MGIVHRKRPSSEGGGAATSRFHRLFDESPIASADDPAVLAFRELIAVRRARDVRGTVRLQRLLRDVHGYTVSLCQVGRRAAR